MFLGFIRYFYIGSVFTPAMYGAWVIYSTILEYADQMHFGLRHIGDREIPRLLRVGHDQEMRVLIRDLLSGIMIIGSVFSSSSQKRRFICSPILRPAP